jgi:hypothetical protein
MKTSPQIFHIPLDERDLLRARAEKANLSASAYVLKAVRAYMQGEIRNCANCQHQQLVTHLARMVAAETQKTRPLPSE